MYESSVCPFSGSLLIVGWQDEWLGEGLTQKVPEQLYRVDERRKDRIAEQSRGGMFYLFMLLLVPFFTGSSLVGV